MPLLKPIPKPDNDPNRLMRFSPWHTRVETLPDEMLRDFLRWAKGRRKKTLARFPGPGNDAAVADFDKDIEVCKAELDRRKEASNPTEQGRT